MVRHIACVLVVAVAPFVAASHAWAAVSMENPAAAAPVCVMRGVAVPLTLLMSLQSVPSLTTGAASTLTFIVATSAGPQTFVVPAGRSVGVVFLPWTTLAGGCLIQLQSSSSNEGTAIVTVDSAPLFSVPLPSP